MLVKQQIFKIAAKTLRKTFTKQHFGKHERFSP